MSKKRFANVWDAIEDTPAQAENMKLRSALIMALKDHIARTGLNQSESAKLGLDPHAWQHRRLHSRADMRQSARRHRGVAR
jgi:hypothetical protein